MTRSSVNVPGFGDQISRTAQQVRSLTRNPKAVHRLLAPPAHQRPRPLMTHALGEPVARPAVRKPVPVTYSQCGHTDMVPQGTRPSACSNGCDPLRPQHHTGWLNGCGP